MGSINEKPEGLAIFHENHPQQSTAQAQTEVVMSETAHGELAEEAVGGTLQDLPPGYYRSFAFVGTILAAYLQYVAVYTGFVIPVNVLSIINEDIGPDPNYTWVAIVVSHFNLPCQQVTMTDSGHSGLSLQQLLFLYWDACRTCLEDVGSLLLAPCLGY